MIMSIASVALADGTAAIVVGTATGEAGDSVAVDVTLTGSGITNGVFKVTYDESTLTFVNATSTVDAEVARISAGTLSVAFAKTTAVSGTIATLNFTIAVGASAGTVTLTPSFAAADAEHHLKADALYVADDPIPAGSVTLTAGSVTVTEEEFIYGDLNGDGEVDSEDSLILDKFIAEWDDYDEDHYNMAAGDLNGDGEVDSEDSLILDKYIAEWDGYEELPILD